MMVCVECLLADKTTRRGTWDVVFATATRRSSGVAQWACERVYAVSHCIHSCTRTYLAISSCILLYPIISHRLKMGYGQKNTSGG